MGWLFLAVAIVCEVVGTLSLRMASQAGMAGAKRWYWAVVPSYLVAFTMLSLCLGAGIGLGVAYGIWAAVGVVITAVASKILFKEPLNLVMSFGILLIVGGVLLVEVGSGH